MRLFIRSWERVCASDERLYVGKGQNIHAKTVDCVFNPRLMLSVLIVFGKFRGSWSLRLVGNKPHNVK